MRAEALLDNNPDVPRAVSLYMGIAQGYSELGLPIRAVAASDEALALRSNSADPGHLDFGRALLGRGANREVIGEYEGARADIAEAMAIFDTQDADVGYEYASGHTTLGYLDARFNNYAEAEQHFRQAIDLLRQIGRAESADAIQVRFDHAQMLAYVNREEEAVQLLRELIEHMRRTLGPTHQRVLWSVATLGSLHTGIGQPEQGVEVMEPSLAAVQAKDSTDDELYAYFVAKLGYAMCRADRYAEGLVLLQKSLVSRRLVYPADHWSIPDAELAIGYCHMQLAQDKEAVMVLNQAIDNFTRIFGPEHNQIEGINRWLAEIEARAATPE